MKTLPILLIASATAMVGACETGDDVEPVPETAPPGAEAPATAQPAGDEATEARELVADAAETARQLTTEAELQQLLQQARGVLIIPTYGQAAAVVGARGGEAVLVARQNGSWSGPAFYDVGGLSVGAQLGAEGGEIAMLLMTDEALERFLDENTFSLDAGAELTIADYSARAQATAGEADVILWSGMEGAFAGASLSVTDINWDEEENRAYYGQDVTPRDVLTGNVTTTQGDDALRNALSGSM